MATVVLLRHGRTTANATGVLAGRTPGVRLDELGRGQAERAGARLAGVPLARVVSSPLERCKQTTRAVLAAQPTEPPLLTERGITECDYGEWQGRTLKELAKETAKATEDIGRKIEAIQGDTSGAVSAISEISEVIGRINDIQTTIASAVEEQTATTNEIARSVTEAAGGANGIADDISQVASAADDTRQGAQNTLQSATELSTMASELKAQVGRFRV